MTWLAEEDILTVDAIGKYTKTFKKKDIQNDFRIREV